MSLDELRFTDDEAQILAIVRDRYPLSEESRKLSAHAATDKPASLMRYWMSKPKETEDGQ